MRKICRVPFCANKDTMKKENPNLRFHEFPSNWTLREKWVKVIRRKNFVPSDNDYVCSVHFHEDDYKTGLKVVRLKPDAVPTIFPGFPKYLQPKNKKSRRELKRATPEVIASFKRSRKMKENEEVDAACRPLSVIDVSTLSDQNILFDSEFGNELDAVEYEVIPIDEALGNILQNSQCDVTNQPAMRDASTQASGMWEKIQELYKIIRKLRTDLLKKTNAISNLTSQNKLLKSQLAELKSQAKTKSPTKLEPRIPKRKSPLSKLKLKSNNIEKKEDLSSYFHPRVPRSLCPPKHTSFPKSSQQMMSLGDILNQTVNCQNIRTSDFHHTANNIPRPAYSKPNTEFNSVSVKQNSGNSISSLELQDTCVSTDCITSPVVCVQQNGYEIANNNRENGFHTQRKLHQLQNCVADLNEELVVVPETCLIESQCNEIIIYSSGNDVRYVEQETENALQGIIN